MIVPLRKFGFFSFTSSVFSTEEDISEEERADENVRDYYDYEKKWDFSATLDANNTNTSTNILKINQVFTFGSQYNPQ